MSDTLSSQAVTLSMIQAADEFARLTGLRPHPSTIRRWRTKGQGGVVLKTSFVAGRYFTSSLWVADFLNERSQSRGTQPIVDTPSVEARAIEKANAKIDALGLVSKKRPT